MIFSKPDWKNFYKGIEKEWLLTNGIGGFASSTIIGANTRRYHGLLVASLKSPVKRHLVISKFDESIIINHKEYKLHTNQTPNYIEPGFRYLQTVKADKVITFQYNVNDVFIEKKVSMIYGKNAVAVVYIIKNGIDSSMFRLMPLVNFRDYHSNTTKLDLNFDTLPYENGVIIKPESTDISIEIRANDGNFISYQNVWFNSMDYYIERERGLNPIEDHYMPGHFEISLKPREEKIITIVGSIDGIETMDGLKIISNEEERISKLIKKAGYNDDFTNNLVISADKFIVDRESTEAKTIIAGYPWFTDWGRDTMIALPGLTFVTKRYEDAKSILSSFAQYIKNGLVPNMFPDEGQEPIFNTVDASLWLFESVYKFLKYTKEYSFVKDNLYVKMKEIIDSYKKGTDFNIRMDIDGLIYAGNPDTQLTWMDAKVGDWVVTPRHGKAVEINALWYNALKVMSHLARKYGDDYNPYERLALKVKKSFEQFWNNNSKCLYDVINGEFKDDKIRPNQIFAVSLSYPVVEGEKAKGVVEMITKELYATYGLRSLSPNDKEYKGIYFGDQYKRDGAYHQGTTWGWLIGHYITAYRRVNDYSKESKEVCVKFLEPFKVHLLDSGVGSISEIFDGDEPIVPRGCFAQAWSVAEVLRAYVEEVK